MRKTDWKREDRPEYCTGFICADFLFDSFDSGDTEHCRLQDERCPYDKGELQEITSEDVGTIGDILNPI